MRHRFVPMRMRRSPGPARSTHVRLRRVAPTTRPSSAGYKRRTRRQMKAIQPRRRVAGGGLRHSMVVMMNPLSTKNTSTPVNPP